MYRAFASLEGAARTKTWRALLAGVKNLTKSLESSMPEAQDGHDARNAIKMFVCTRGLPGGGKLVRTGVFEIAVCLRTCVSVCVRM